MNEIAGTQVAHYLTAAATLAGILSPNLEGGPKKALGLLSRLGKSLMPYQQWDETEQLRDMLKKSREDWEHEYGSLNDPEVIKSLNELEDHLAQADARGQASARQARRQEVDRQARVEENSRSRTKTWKELKTKK